MGSPYREVLVRWFPNVLPACSAIAFLGAAACAPNAESGDAGMPDAGRVESDVESGVEAVDRPIVEVADRSIPSAILGTAPPPRGRSVNYLPGDDATTGYVVEPEGDGPFPAIILIHEWDGLTDRIRQTADALAAEGYVAFAADLYRGRTGTNRQENMVLVRETEADPAAMISNLDAAVAWLRARPDVTGRIGTVGWCFGGGVALSFGLDGVEHEATAIFYGSLVTDPERLASLDHEVYGTFAELDRGPPVEQVEAFEAALRAAGVENDIHVYDGVNHGFWLRAGEDPETRLEPARDAWQRLRAYFRRTLRG